MRGLATNSLSRPPAMLARSGLPEGPLEPLHLAHDLSVVRSRPRRPRSFVPVVVLQEPAGVRVSDTRLTTLSSSIRTTRTRPSCGFCSLILPRIDPPSGRFGSLDCALTVQIRHSTDGVEHLDVPAVSLLE